ncbi:MAG: autotransporter outer membrane beta-barrel domain-containing protein [Chlorobiaceae bacterium]|nr:autotransporter outer membrane beta-barrel domain-containing protein [Chlorobiaceae bacterium]
MKKRNIALVALFVALGAGQANAESIPSAFVYDVTTTTPTGSNSIQSAITSANGDSDTSTIFFGNTTNPFKIQTSNPSDIVTVNQSVIFETTDGYPVTISSTSVAGTSLLRTINSPVLTLDNGFSVDATGTGNNVTAVYGTNNLTINSFYATGSGLLSNDINGTFTAVASNNQAYGLFAKDNLTINGNLTGSVIAQAYNDEAYGIRAYNTGKNLNINGTLSGTVTAQAGDDEAYGLRGANDLKITGDLAGSVTAQAGYDFLNNIVVNGDHNNAYGLRASKNDLSIGGTLSGTVTAQAGGVEAYGLYAEDHITIGTAGNVFNGTVTAQAGDDGAYGLFTLNDDITVNGDFLGNVNAQAGYNFTTKTVVNGSNDDAYGFRAGDNLNINGNLSGTVKAQAGGDDVYGLYASGGNINITGSLSGNVTAQGGSGEAYGLFTDGNDDITIGGNLNGTITAQAGYDFANGKVVNGNFNTAYGLHAGYDLNINGNLSGAVKAQAGGDGAYGLYADQHDININNNLSGNITAQAGDDNAYGLFTDGNDDIIIGGDLSGNVTAQAGYDFASVTVANGTHNSAYGLYAGDDLKIGGILSGTVIAEAGGHSAAGIAAGDHIGTYDSGTTSYTPLIITGNISATANGAAAGILADGQMDLDISGNAIVSGTDKNETDLGYAIRSGRFDGFGGYALFTNPNKDNITVEENAQLIGNVYLGQGNDTMVIKDNAIISTVPTLSGGYSIGSESTRDDIASLPVNMTTGDLLKFDGWTGMVGTKVVEWENIWVTNNSKVDLGDGIVDIIDNRGKMNITSTSGLVEFNIDPGSFVYGGGHSPVDVTIAGNMVNNGTYSLLDDEVNDTLTVTGNYSGTGVLLLDADLSTSGNTSAELVTINGTASGPTKVFVNNVVNPVAVTAGNGIKIIDTNNPVSSNAFLLGNPDDFGPFAVNLVEGSDHDWYLQSPGYREEAAVLQAVTPFVEKLGYESIPRFHERRTYTWFADKNAEKSAFWVRGYGSKYRLGMSGDAATELKGYSGGMQIGADIAAGGKDTRHNIGLYAGIGYNEADVAGLRSDLAGKLNDTAYSVGAYVTVHNPDKFYIEGVAQATSHNIDIDYLTYPKHDVDMWSYLGSLEVGVGIPIGKCFTLQPQAQLVYQHTDGLGITTPILTGDVNIEEHDALQGRLGITGMFKSCDFDFNPFFEINLIKDFSESNRVTYSMNNAYYADTKEPVTLSSKPETLFLGGAIGISRRISEKNNLSYFLKAEAIYGLDNLDSYNYRLNVGIRKAF